LSADVRRAAEILRAGGLVAFPTETVYGLGADASNAAAVARLYAAKGRPAEHPVIIHFASAREAFEWGREIPEAARRLAARFWPGPLTLIVKRSATAKDFVTGGQDSVGLRVPSHPVAQALLREFGGGPEGHRYSGVAAPSANLFGNVSATTAAHVKGEVKADLVLDGGSSEIGIESTIVDLSGEEVTLLRPGGISKEELEKALNRKIHDRKADFPRHSGGLERHYAPRTPALLVPPHALDAEIARRGASVAVLAFSRPDERVEYWIRMPKDPRTYAQRLYAALRELDGAGCATILIETPPDTNEWTAVKDRLTRAAG
jgi:L-threonylcarbamoyladenylate synthase